MSLSRSDKNSFKNFLERILLVFATRHISNRLKVLPKFVEIFSYPAIADIDKGKSITLLAKVIVVVVVVAAAAAAAVAVAVAVVVNYRPETDKDQQCDDFKHAKHFFRFELQMCSTSHTIARMNLVSNNIYQ